MFGNTDILGINLSLHCLLFIAVKWVWVGWIREQCMRGHKHENRVMIPCWPVFELPLQSSSWMSIFWECSYIKNNLWGNWEIHSWPVLVAPFLPGRLPGQSTIWSSSICVWFQKTVGSRKIGHCLGSWPLQKYAGQLSSIIISYQICLNPPGWEVRDTSQPRSSSRKFGLTYTDGF